MKRIKVLFLVLISVISSYAATKDDGCLSIGNYTVEAGGSIKIPVSMTNKIDIYGVQCDIYLSSPNLSLKVNNRGKYVFGTNGDRVDGQTEGSSLQDDGSIRYMLVDYTADNPFYENSGELFYINVEVAAGISGEYTITLKGITLATDENKINCDDIVCTLTVTTATGFSAIIDTNGYNKRFDLSGRVLGEDAKGIIVTNGRKIAVK